MGQVLTAPIAAVTAGADFNFPIGVVPTYVASYTVGKISISGVTAITAQGATNFNSIAIDQYRAGVKVRTLATWNAGTTALVADTALQLTVATENQAVLQAGDVLRGTITHTSAGSNQVATIVNVELV